MKLILFKTGCYVICELGRAKPGEAYLCCRPSACPCTMRSRAGISGGAWRRLVWAVLPLAFAVVSRCQGSSSRLARREAGNVLSNEEVAGCWQARWGGVRVRA